MWGLAVASVPVWGIFSGGVTAGGCFSPRMGYLLGRSDCWKLLFSPYWGIFWGGMSAGAAFLPEWGILAEFKIPGGG